MRISLSLLMIHVFTVRSKISLISLKLILLEYLPLLIFETHWMLWQEGIMFKVLMKAKWPVLLRLLK